MKKNYALYINGELDCVRSFEQVPTLEQFCLRAGVAMIPTGHYELWVSDRVVIMSPWSHIIAVSEPTIGV